MPETMKLLAITKSKIAKDKNGEIVPHLEITEAVLMHCNIVKSDSQESCIHLFLMNNLANY